MNSNERVIFINDPYNITIIEDARSIVGLTGTITYEQYCTELRNIIDGAIRTQHLEEITSCDGIIIESCKEPPNFEALMIVLAEVGLSLSQKCQLLFKNCSFSGMLYVNSVINFVKSFSCGKQQIHFDIILDQKNLKPSEHDQAKLAMLTNVSFFSDIESAPVIRRFVDDQFIREINRGSLEKIPRKQMVRDDDELIKKYSSLENPTYFFRSQIHDKFSPRSLLMHFFSQAHQQRSDYTCGSATLKMVADYYLSLEQQPFCGKPIASHQVTVKKSNGKVITAPVWKILNSFTEFELAERVKTTEAVGSDIVDMRNGLIDLGLQVIDDNDGINSEDLDAVIIPAHKEMLWHKIQEVLNLGVPVIINMRDRFEAGHYEVAIGIDDKNNILLAEPGTALTGKVEFESIPKEKFIGRWKNTSGKLQGRFLIVPPNEATAQKIEFIFKDTPHYYNGKAINKETEARSSLPSQKK